MEEENKTPIVEEEESDFADEVKMPEPKVEEKPAEEEVKPEEQEPEEPEEPEIPLPDSITDEKLQEIEAARSSFYDLYKKQNTKKAIVTVVALIVMLVGWVVPNFIESIKTLMNGNFGLILALIISALAIAAMAISSSFFRKATEKDLKAYFNDYYGKSYEYGLSGLKVDGFNGALENKLDEEEFKACGLYKDVFKVGSRYLSTFNYEGMDVSVVDAAGQTKGAKQLQTIFVGKYMVAPNNYKGSGIYIYFKGNNRSLPPNNLDAYPLIEKVGKCTIAGEKKEEKFLTKSIRTALSKIKVNKTLVDVAISIQPGKTYFALGYEDNLMVIPLQNKLDPRPYWQFKSDMEVFLPLAALLNKKPTKAKEE